MITGRVPIKADKDVTESDIQHRNLILFGGPKYNTVTRRLAARLPVKPPQRPLEQQLVELVTPRPGQMVRTSEQKLWQALAQAPDNGELYLHLAQLCSLRREPAEAVRMLRLAARDRVLSSTHLNQRALFQDAAFEPIKYTPEFLTYVRSLPEAKE